MKKYLILLLTFFALGSCEQDDTILDATVDKKMPKVDVCHYDAVTDTWKTISVNGNALKAHLKHGDFEGNCDDLYTYVPDDMFEAALIYWGYDDGPLDDYVLTSNINSIEELSFEEPCCVEPWATLDDGLEAKGIRDFTGIDGFESLKNLYINKHQINIIDLSKNINLERLGLSSANGTITELDLSSNINLIWISLETWGYDFINLQNGNNTSLVWGDKNVGPATCVQVDHLDYAISNWVIYAGVFSEDCSGLTYVPDDGFEKALILWGYDEGPLDNYVLTANIDQVETLDFGEPCCVQPWAGNPPEIPEDMDGVQDFTGIEAFTNLKRLVINRHKIEVKLDLSKNVLLETIDFDNVVPIGGNALQFFDLSNNSNLKNVWLAAGGIESLNLKNGNNTLIENLFLYTPGAICIQVDDPNYSSTNPNWDNNTGVPYSTDCGY